MMNAVSTSKNECCFRNMVDRMIEEDKRKDPMRIPFLSANSLLRMMAK